MAVDSVPNLVEGAILIVWGIYFLFRYRKSAQAGAKFHRKVASLLPWLYANPVGAAATSTRSWRTLSLIGALVFLGVGIYLVTISFR